MLTHQLTELSAHSLPLRAASPPLKKSALGQHYVAARRGEDQIWLVSGPYPNRAAVTQHLERTRAIACGHSPAGERMAWGGFHAMGEQRMPRGLLESPLGYPAPKNTLLRSQTPLTLRQFDSFCHSVRSRGFNRVLTHCGPLPIEKWRPVNVFSSHGTGLDPFCAGFEWVGTNLIRTMSVETSSTHLERVWTFGIEGRYAFESPPMTLGRQEWRLVVLRDRRTAQYEWRRNAVRQWNPQENWPDYSPKKTLLGLPDRVHELEQRHADALSKVILGNILDAEHQTLLNGEWYEAHSEHGSIQGPLGPQEMALQRWITRAKDVPGTPRERLQNFLAQRFIREELLRFWADVQHLCWPATWNGAPWKTAQHIASCVANDRTQEIAADHADDLAPHILASLARPAEDWARVPAPATTSPGDYWAS
jgi:hypothetical protein